MRHDVRTGTLLRIWRKDDAAKALVSALLSFGCTALFALYHGYLWLSYGSVWHGSIGGFYLLLMAVRGSLLLTERNVRKRSAGERNLRRRRIFRISSVLLLGLDLVLILPVAMMALLAKPVYLGKIPSIAMAAYTTYKIITASLHIHKQKRAPHQNLLISELRVINFIDALVSVLTLQSTLILVNQESSDISSMLPLTASSSAVIYSIIVITTLYMLQNGLAESKGNTT